MMNDEFASSVLIRSGNFLLPNEGICKFDSCILCVHSISSSYCTFYALDTHLIGTKSCWSPAVYDADLPAGQKGSVMMTYRYQVRYGTVRY
jgi:hypothetical protein